MTEANVRTEVFRFQVGDVPFEAEVVTTDIEGKITEEVVDIFPPPECPEAVDYNYILNEYHIWQETQHTSFDCNELGSRGAYDVHQS